MTKHLHDEVFGKLPVSMDDTEVNLQLLQAANTLGICGVHVAPINTIHTVESNPLTLKAKTKKVSLRTRLGKIMHKLYDLEPDNAPEKPLNVDLGVDLYQMEKY